MKISKQLAGVFLTSVLTIGTAQELKAVTSTIKSITEIEIKGLEHSNQTIVFFDLDDTVFDFPHMLGSRGFRTYIKSATKNIPVPESQNKTTWHDLITHHLTNHYPVITVERSTAEFINELQGKGFITCGLTSRERNKWYDTFQDGVDALTTTQLSNLGIHFGHDTLKNISRSLEQDPEYFSGTFFANTDLKGDYLLQLFQNVEDRPKKVIFIDDKKSQVDSVAKALSELGIESECYFYTATEDKAKSFNPLLANIQLCYFLQSGGQDILSDVEASQIACQDMSKDESFYLNEALNLLKQAQ